MKGRIRYFLLGLGPLGLIILIIANHNSYFAEHVCALHLYKWLSIGISSVTTKVPFSIGEMGIIILSIVGVGLLIRFFLRLRRGKGNRKEIASNFLWNLATVCSVIFFLFVILCGTNYHRYSFAYYRGITVQDSSVEELHELCICLSKQANILREQVPCEDERGIFQLSTSIKDTGIKARDTMNQLGEEYPVLSGWNATVKEIFFSDFMSRTETTGIFFNFPMEANVNTKVPQFSIPATMCHELSHLRGFMKEEEASYIGYLACMASDDVEFKYSGVMDALISAGNALYRMDSELYKELVAQYSDKVKADLIANSEYWAQYHGKVISSVSNKVNDTYLKANQQADGIQSYGRMVDLLLADQRKRKR